MVYEDVDHVVLEDINAFCTHYIIYCLGNIRCWLRYLIWGLFRFGSEHVYFVSTLHGF
jgi:hypothetical protein